MAIKIKIKTRFLIDNKKFILCNTWNQLIKFNVYDEKKKKNIHTEVNTNVNAIITKQGKISQQK